MKTEQVLEAAEKVGLLNKKQSELMQLHSKEEPLCDELKDYVFKKKFGTIVHHPLVIEMFYDPQHCALLNYRFELKKQEREKAKATGNWVKFIYLHERPYRLEALCAAQKAGAKDPQLVRDVWIDSENIWQNKDLWKLVWATMKNPADAMDANEKTVVEWMPDKIQIHRGIRHTRHNRRGMSWTRDKERAVWFAVRLKQSGLIPTVLTATVKKADILAYFQARNEEEVVIMPHKLPRRITAYEIG